MDSGTLRPCGRSNHPSPGHQGTRVEVQQGSEAYLLHAAAFDVAGIRVMEIDAKVRETIIVKYPGLDMKSQLTKAFLRGATGRPESRTTVLYKLGLPKLIAAAPFGD